MQSATGVVAALTAALRGKLLFAAGALVIGTALFLIYTSPPATIR